MLDCWSLVASGGENFDKRCRDFLRRKNRGISEILGGGRLKSPDSFSLIRAAASYGWLRSFANAQATSSMTVALGERRRGQVPLLYIQRSPTHVCQACISQINWNLKFRSRTSVLCRSLFCLTFEKTAEEGIIREVKSLGYFRDCL